jgi:hypothetical protein
MSIRRLALPLLLTMCSLPNQAPAQPAERNCGIIGCTTHGKGEIVSKNVDDEKVVVEFTVGTKGYAPYARERLTLTPGIRRKNNQLTVEYRAKAERVEVKIPGGLGALWEIDLSNNEGSALLKKVYLELSDGPIEPTTLNANQAEFTVKNGTKGPYTIIFRVGFFGTTDDIRVKKEAAVERRVSSLRRGLAEPLTRP